jgi:rare lipoprotein A
MSNKIFIITFSILSLFVGGNLSLNKLHQEKNKEKVTKQKEKKAVATAKTDTTKVSVKTEVKEVDSLRILDNLKFKLLKKQAHASYYHDKFNGKKTASGARFDNSKYTAAHKKLPFGTLVKVTNEANGKSVIVEITDRGPYSRAREIDLSKKAFMEITSNKNSGVVFVTLEVVDK